jgi:hypothetical protein
VSADRQQLDARVLAWMREDSWQDDETRFDELARAVFAHQFERCEPYGRFCLSRGVTPASVREWRGIPAVPTGAFKEMALRCFPEAETCKTFRTSGTATERRGELHLDTLDLYEASLLPSLSRFLFPDLGAQERMPIRILAPSPIEAPDSSLSHMFGALLDELGGPGSGYDIVAGSPQFEELCDEFATLSKEGDAVAICGTAFAFVHLLDALGGQRFELPRGSRIMETGGFKGRSRVVSRQDLHAGLRDALGIPLGRIVNQYGMTELGSQFYDSRLVEPDAPVRKLGPPWARVRVTDAETGDDVAAGEPGVIVVHDLANTGSVAAIQTADVGVQLGDGFEVQGRDPEAEARGCSIAADAMLSA